MHPLLAAVPRNPDGPRQIHRFPFFRVSDVLNNAVCPMHRTHEQPDRPKASDSARGLTARAVSLRSLRSMASVGRVASRQTFRRLFATGPSNLKVPPLAAVFGLSYRYTCYLSVCGNFAAIFGFSLMYTSYLSGVFHWITAPCNRGVPGIGGVRTEPHRYLLLPYLRGSALARRSSRTMRRMRP